MLYPVYVWKDEGSAYGATVPDMPGVNTAADELADLPALVQEAVEAMFDGEDVAVPQPSAIERWQSARAYRGGFWLLVEVDLSRVNARAVRVNVSMPESLLARIDRAASDRHLSRSGFLALAAEREMARAPAA